MPISLRLPSDIDAQITGFGARQGLTKSAVIVRSIQEFLARNAQPTSLQIYQGAMRGASNAAVQRENQHKRDDAFRAAAEVGPHKLQVREVIRSKHAKPPDRWIHLACCSPVHPSATGSGSRACPPIWHLRPWTIRLTAPACLPTPNCPQI